MPVTTTCLKHHSSISQSAREQNITGLPSAVLSTSNCKLHYHLLLHALYQLVRHSAMTVKITTLHGLCSGIYPSCGNVTTHGAAVEGCAPSSLVLARKQTGRPRNGWSHSNTPNSAQHFLPAVSVLESNISPKSLLGVLYWSPVDKASQLLWDLEYSHSVRYQLSLFDGSADEEVDSH